MITSMSSNPLRSDALRSSVTPVRRRLLAAIAVAASGVLVMTSTPVGAAGGGRLAPDTVATASNSRQVAAQTQCGTDLSTNPAAPRLSLNTTRLSSSGRTTVTVTGTRYLTGRYLCGGSKFGGIYVFFGWVAPGGQWGPSWRSATSSAGQFGTTYTYPGEGGAGDTRDDGSGTLRLVSFTAGGSSGSETPFHMDANGNWTTTLNVAGPVYSWKNLLTGASQRVDCRVVQCGIFTMGAHGISSRTNELFVPVTFAAPPPPPSTVRPPTTQRPSTPTTVAPRPAPTPEVQGRQVEAPPGGAQPAPAAGGAGATSTTAPQDPTSTTAPSGASAGDDGAADTQDDTSTSDAGRSDSEPSPDGGNDSTDDPDDQEAALVSVDDGGGGLSPALLLVPLALLVAGLVVTGTVLRRRAAPAHTGGSPD